MTKDKREGWLKELNVGDVAGFVEPLTERHKQSVDNKVLKYNLTKTLENYDFNTLPLGQLKKNNGDY